jgi:hypothetical protein
MEMNGCYTDEEIKEIKAGSAAYDEMCREKDEAPEAFNPFRELYQVFEEITLDSIRFYQEDIGALIKVREAFSESQEIQERVRDLINMESHSIEELRKDIEHDREAIAGFESL